MVYLNIYFDEILTSFNKLEISHMLGFFLICVLMSVCLTDLENDVGQMFPNHTML